MGKCGTSASVNHSRRKAMKKIILSLLAAGLSSTALLHAAETVKLDKPDLERGAPVMKALSDRQSIRSFSEKMLSQKDLSGDRGVGLKQSENRQAQHRLAAARLSNDAGDLSLRKCEGDMVDGGNITRTGSKADAEVLCIQFHVRPPFTACGPRRHRGQGSPGDNQQSS